MKQKLLLFSCLLLFLASCEKESFDPANPDVAAYVALLIDGNIDPYAPLPTFKPDQIPELLAYADDFREIPRFTINPISSYAVMQYRLGECLLWVIEGVRTEDVPASQKQGYPSLAPVLFDKNSTQPGIRLDEAGLSTAYHAYQDWWDRHKSQPFEDFKNINPLENPGLYWR